MRYLATTGKPCYSEIPPPKPLRHFSNLLCALRRYADTGFLAIDNNVAEREMKRLAIGRKNWLHLGSEQGGRTAAILFSFTSTCQRLSVEPWHYLSDVLKRLPTAKPEDLPALLPDRWRAPPPEPDNKPSTPAPSANSA